MCKNGRLVSYHHLVTDVDNGSFEIPIISQLSQVKRSPDVNPGDNGVRPSRSTFSAGKCSAEYDENALNGACTDDKE